MKTAWKELDIVKKITVIVQIDFIYCRVELERKLLNKIVHVTDDMKTLVSHSVCQGTIQFLITQAKNDNNEGKRQIIDRTNSLTFFKGKWFQKTIFERRIISFH